MQKFEDWENSKIRFEHEDIFEKKFKSKCQSENPSLMYETKAKRKCQKYEKPKPGYLRYIGNSWMIYI